MPNTHTTLTSLFTDIADAIRAKSGESGQIVADTFPTAISNLNVGATLNNIHIYKQPDKTTQVIGSNFDNTGMLVAANYTMSSENFDVIISDYTYPTTVIQNGTNNITISYTIGSITKTTTVSITGTYVGVSLNDTPWFRISEIAQQGIGDTYWAIGDCKEIILNGNIGDYFTADNLNVYIYILDFNHPVNKTIADNNIIFGGFKKQYETLKSIALCDSNYPKYHSHPPNNSVMKDFTINHAGGYVQTYGGWKATDIRYDILGSTNIQPSNYLSDRYSSSNPIGYDGDISAATTNIIPNTLMSTLPADFRSVLRPYSRYIDNKGGGSNNDSDITLCIDMIFLLSYTEVFGSDGATIWPNQYEQNHQNQMAYYANGNFISKYCSNDIIHQAEVLLATPEQNATYFCAIDSNILGGDNSSQGIIYTNEPGGLAPAFKV